MRACLFLVSAGDLMEGVTSEAASLAGTLSLGKLVYLYDDNGISIEGSTDITFTEDVAMAPTPPKTNIFFIDSVSFFL